MADLAQLESALVKADAAGDSDGARVLAGEIRRMREAPAEKQAPQAQPVPAWEKYLQGVRDPITGAAQLLYNALPQSVQQAGDRFGNKLADMGLPVAYTPEGGFNELVKQQEAEYQAKRSDAGESGIDAWRLAGGIATTAIPATKAASVVASALPKTSSLLAKALQGSAVGGGVSATAPVTEGDYWSEKGKQVGTGALVGGAMPLATGAVARVLRPQTNPQVQQLMKQGVIPTPGQIMGGRWQATEDKLTSLPILGDAISSSRRKGLDEFNRAAYTRALAPVGEKVPQTVGREGVAAVRDALSKRYDALLPKLGFSADKQFTSELGNLSSMAQNLAPQEARRFETILRDHLSKMSPKGGMQGETYKTVESALGNDIKRFSSSPDAYQQELAQALKEMKRVFHEALVRSNPQHAKELSKVDLGYANYVRLRDAASRQGSLEGKFTPAQLSAAVRSQDKTVGKRAFSEGKALMQDLTDAGKSVLSPKYPDSGTFGRLALGGGLLAGAGIAGGNGWVDPKIAALLTLPAVAYLPGGRQAIAAALTKRPELAGTAANTLRSMSPVFSGGAGLLASQQP